MFIFFMALETEEEKEKFEILYKKYKAGMYRIAWNILKNEKDAEDIVHESFWAIIENFEKYTMFRVAKHGIILLL